MTIQTDLLAPQTGVGYQFYGADGFRLATRVTVGIVPGPTPGSYVATTTPPADAVGVVWDCSDSDVYASEDLSARLSAGGGGGGLSLELIAALEGAQNILLARPYVPTPRPVAIVPDPSDDLQLGRVYGNFVTPGGDPVAGTDVFFRLLVPGDGSAAQGGWLVHGDLVTAKTDDAGHFETDLARNDLLEPANSTRWQVECSRVWSRPRVFVLDTPLFDLSALTDPAMEPGVACYY